MFALLFLLFRLFLALSYQQVPHTGTDTNIQIHLRTFRPNAYLLIERKREREGERAGRVAVCGWAGVSVWGARLTVRLQTTRRRRDPEIPALIRSNATIARGCLAKNSIRYKPGTKDIKPSSQYSSSQNVQKQLSRSRSPPTNRFSFSQRERFESACDSNKCEWSVSVLASFSLPPAKKFSKRPRRAGFEPQGSSVIHDSWSKKLDRWLSIPENQRQIQAINPLIKKQKC